MTNTSIAERSTIALLFAGSAALTIVWCSSMSSMSMPMPGGWTMSMTWMRSPGQTWLGAAAAFTGMWTVMMVAMMLPALMPALSRYRQLASVGSTATATLTYFAVWAVFGVVVFAFGTALATIEMRHPALARIVPLAAAALVLAAGAWQFTPWKMRCLMCCRSMPRHGLDMALQCICCCANLMIVLLVVGVMNVPAMAIIGAAIAFERIAPRGEAAARIIGVAVAAFGIVMIAS